MLNTSKAPALVLVVGQSKDEDADTILSRLWMHACITQDEAAKDVLVYQQGRGTAGLHAYEAFLAKRTAARAAAKGRG